MSSRRLLPVPPLVFALLLAGLAGRVPAPAQAGEWESLENNVVLIVPDDPSPWEWRPASPDWAKAGIIKGAIRTVDKLKSGKPAEGHGGLLHLAVRDAPKDKSLEDLAADKGIRDFLLARFGGTETDVEVEETTVISGDEKEHPAALVRAEGKAANLRGKVNPAQGVLILTVSKGKLYLLRMYAFPTEFDEEGLVVDIDYMEGNCLSLIKTKEKAVAKPPPDVKDPANGGGEPTPEEEEGKEETLENVAQGWRIVKHKKLPMPEISEEEVKQDVVLKFEGSDASGGFSVYMYAIPHGRIIDGRPAPAPDLSKWMTYHWWNNFTTNHPKGGLYTYKWPRRTATGAKTFLTLPDMEDEKAKLVVVEPDADRPIEVSVSDALKKLKFVDKPKVKNIGKRFKGSEPMRGALEGKRPRYAGSSTVFRYAWRSGKGYSYRLFVSFYGMAYKKWGAAIRETLESLEFGIKFK
jgi:hypothetical protein